MSNIADYKCSACGGSLAFDPSSQKMKCEFCDSLFTLEELEATKTKEDAKSDKLDDLFNTDGLDHFTDEETSGMIVYSCQSCGGEVIGDETTGSTRCPYCDNNIVMKGQFSGELKPDLIIPFKHDKKMAKDTYYGYVKGKKLVPARFKDQKYIDEIKGLYVPFWIFSCQADGMVEYQAEKDHSYSDDEYEYTDTDHYTVTRSGSIDFTNIPIDASEKMADDLMESIEPFDIEAGKPFNSAFLAGYMADKFDVDIENSKDRVHQRIKNSTEQAFKSSVKGFDRVNVLSSNIHISDGTVRYALLPVWILNIKFNDKLYTFAMNGQTGEIVGELPVDKKQYWIWLAIWAVVIGLVLYGLMWIIMML